MVTADTAGKWPKFLEPTTATSPTSGCTATPSCTPAATPTQALDRWAARVGEWRDQGRDVFVYFDNDVKVHAPFDAQRLAGPAGARPRAGPA